MTMQTNNKHIDKMIDVILKNEKSAATAGVVGIVASIQLFTDWDPMGRCFTLFGQLRKQNNRLSCAGDVNAGITEYQRIHSEDAEKRSSQYKSLVNAYYDLATVFYEWGWGPCFHFHYRFPFEKFWEGTRRHEYQLVAKLDTKRGDHLLDVGCGIGGPMRNIARFLMCKVTGLTLNPYQVERGNEITAQDDSVAGKCISVQGDFMELPFPKNSFQGAYAIEATCHAPDRVACYKQVFDVLEPGARFALYEWCMTDKYDPNNEDHQRMKKEIEIGNGLPDVASTIDCYKAMKDAGFEMLEAYDYADGYEKDGQAFPWYTPLTPSWNPFSQRFQFNWLGGMLTPACVFLLEMLWIAPKGSSKTQIALQTGGFALRDAGKERIFTTAYFMVGRKPLKA